MKQTANRLLALLLAQVKYRLTTKQARMLFRELSDTAEQIQWILDTQTEAVHEAALKLKEVSYLHAEAYAAGEMKHGPIALVDAEMPVVVIATRNGLYEKVLSNIQEIKARKGRVIAIVTKGDTVISKIADTCIELPETMECLDPLITTVPLQLLAYHIAVCKGMDVDQPRNLAKSVTVE